MIHTYKASATKIFLRTMFPEIGGQTWKLVLTYLFFLIFQASAKIGMPLRDRGNTQTSFASNVLAKAKYPATDDTVGISENRKYA